MTSSATARPEFARSSAGRTAGRSDSPDVVNIAGEARDVDPKPARAYRRLGSESDLKYVDVTDHPAAAADRWNSRLVCATCGTICVPDRTLQAWVSGEGPDVDPIHIYLFRSLTPTPELDALVRRHAPAAVEPLSPHDAHWNRMFGGTGERVNAQTLERPESEPTPKVAPASAPLKITDLDPETTDPDVSRAIVRTQAARAKAKAALEPDSPMRQESKDRRY